MKSKNAKQRLVRKRKTEWVAGAGEGPDKRDAGPSEECRQTSQVKHSTSFRNANPKFR